ncbi:MAG: hypothetical protein ACO3FI_06850 [Cyclobacteriaceae bacterium]
MAKKWIILFLALALPVFIFLFLKEFGSNQFDLPFIHQNGKSWPSDCADPGGFPFRVKEGLFMTVPGWHTLILLENPEAEAAQRIPVEIDTSTLKVLFKPEFADPCLLGVSRSAAAVLIDSIGVLRGIFEKLDRDETDRLIMETKILLKDY